MGRLLDEDDVIDIINFECGKWTGLSKTVEKEIKALPSAQPELIRCKDCVRYGEPECLMAYDGKQWAEADGFCHAGERGEQDE